MKTWLAAFTLFAALSTAAQAEIVAGTVVDRSSNQPVPNVTVTVTFTSGAKPAQTRTDAAGYFSIETSETPTYVALSRTGFEPFTMSIVSVAPSVIGDLHLVLNTRLTPMKDDYRQRSMCGAFQPSQSWDHYVIIPGGSCGAPKR